MFCRLRAIALVTPKLYPPHPRYPHQPHAFTWSAPFHSFCLSCSQELLMTQLVYLTMFPDDFVKPGLGEEPETPPPVSREEYPTIDHRRNITTRYLQFRCQVCHTV